jgi:hypothetical protein
MAILSIYGPGGQKSIKKGENDHILRFFDIFLPAPVPFWVKDATFCGVGARSHPKMWGLTTGIPKEPILPKSHLEQPVGIIISE